MSGLTALNLTVLVEHTSHEQLGMMYSAFTGIQGCPECRHHSMATMKLTLNSNALLQPYVYR